MNATRLYVDDGIAREHAVMHRIDQATLDTGRVIRRDLAADDFPFKLEISPKYFD